MNIDIGTKAALVILVTALNAHKKWVILHQIFNQVFKSSIESHSDPQSLQLQGDAKH